jgi:DNA-binding response OmpR family regulator
MKRPLGPQGGLNGSEAHRNFSQESKRKKPDLVVLDIKTVYYNGTDILQDIRNQFYDLPVILSTAYDSFKEDMKSIAADFYVTKSFDLTELKQKIAMALDASSPVDKPRPASLSGLPK